MSTTQNNYVLNMRMNAIKDEIRLLRSEMQAVKDTISELKQLMDSIKEQNR